MAGEDSFVLFVRVATPTALEALIREIRRRANVSTRTTVVLQTFFERQRTPRRRIDGCAVNLPEKSGMSAGNYPVS